MILLIAFVATLSGGFFLPWWWPAAVGFALGFWKPQTRLRSFGFNFLGAALSWALTACVFQIGNHGLLAERISGLFGLPNGGYLVVVTGLIGGLTAGFGALTGRYCSDAYSRFKPRRTSIQ